MKENDNHKSDDVVAERDRLHVVFTLPLGILAGYYGIKYQSVWVAFGIHSVWNLIMPAVLPILMLLEVLAFLGTSSLWDRVRWRQRRSW